MMELIRTSVEDNKSLTEVAVLKVKEFKEKLVARMLSYHKYKIPLIIFLLPMLPNVVFFILKDSNGSMSAANNHFILDIVEQFKT